MPENDNEAPIITAETMSGTVQTNALPVAELLERKPPRRIGSLGRTPHQVMAIAAALAASSPGMFDGPDLFSERARRLDREFEDDPRLPGGYRIEREVRFAPSGLPYEMRPQPRALPRERAPRPIVTSTRGGKPAGSKLARKAARGRL